MDIAAKRTLEALKTAESGKLEPAARQLELSLKRGIVSADLVRLYTEVIGQLGEPGRALRVIADVLADEQIDLPVSSQIQMLTVSIDQTSVADEDMRRDLLVDLCNVASMGTEEDWVWAGRSDLREEIAAAMLPPAAGVDLAELLLFAPEKLGYRNLAAQTIELAATGEAGDQATIRAAERLLHAAGIPDAAYRLEQTRRQRHAAENRKSVPPKRSVPRLNDVVVAVAGGHPPFRTMVREALEQEGGSIREIPARFESVRRERDVLDALKGASVAVIVIPQIAHSTSDQITKVSRRLGLQVLYLRSASVETLLKLVRTWRQKERSGRRESL